MTQPYELLLMDQARVSRTLKRMAYQVSEQNRKNRSIVLIGLEGSGMAVASQLGRYLTEIYGHEVPVLELDPGVPVSEQDFDSALLKDRYPLLVDDVIFSGQTMFQALHILFSLSVVKELHTAVLVDRGHRRFPVEAEVVGIELSTKLREHVSVLSEGDLIRKVSLEIE